MNLHQNAKNQAFLSFCSKDKVNLKILQSDWPRAFWPISQEPGFSKHGIIARIQQILETFFTDQIQNKLMTKSSNKFKKPCIWPIFFFFFHKIRLSRTTTLGPLTPCWVSEKTSEPIPRKLPGRRTEGHKDRRTLIHRTLPAMAEGFKKSCNLIDWEHFNPLSQVKKIFQIWDLWRNTASNLSFHYRTNSVKINDKSVNKFKKLCFGSIFGPFFQIFGLKFFFSRRSCSVTCSFIWVSSTMPKFRQN